MLVKDAIYFHSSDEDLRGAHSVGRGTPEMKMALHSIGSEAQLF